MTRLKVAVRVRPLSKTEIEKNSIKIAAVENGDTIAVTNIKVPEQNAGDSRERTRRFTFDYCFHENSTQDDVYSAIGKVVGESIKKRHHACVLAYGQSSSGKTHTMMGFPHDRGLTPRLCENVFNYLQESAVGDELLSDMRTSVSYLEIYNEKVRDLLQLKDKCERSSNVPALRIREHPKKGPYVQGLTEHQVVDSSSLLQWLRFGNGNRSVAATSSNPQSSRSHAVFIITCDGVKLHLVDLAGSERAGSRCYSVSRFREGSNINKSLVALGNVISALAEQSFKSPSRNCTRRFVPYRDSVLTWLLKDTLGGNSQTVMIATVSPSSSCYNETVNTLRFGQRAKLIVSRPVVNEDPKEKTIRELRAEIHRLKELLNLNQSPPLVEMSMQNGNHYLSSEGNSSAEKETSSLRNDSLTSSLSELSLNSPPLPEIAETTEPLEEQNSIIINRREKLLPLMDVSTKLIKDAPKLRRTFTELSMEKEGQPRYGSHETLPTKSKTPPRRRSMDKPTALLKTIVQKKPLGADKAVSTDKSKPEVESKVDSIRKQPLTKQRSQIVAAVTHRLYSKSKKKEVGTNTEETAKELSICSNARWRLKELTQRALRAHRSRNVEVQTDLFPVLRVKETSTDVTDLKLVLEEVKEVGTSVKPFQKDAATLCAYLDSFEEELPHDYKNAFVVTRSCGTQSGETANGTQQPMVSFSNFLKSKHDEQFEIANLYTKNPIYTSSVNINISHNYLNGTTTSTTTTGDAISDDSLEEPSSKVHLPTPDLLSNHNSLETASTQTVQKPIRFASCTIIAERFTKAEPFCGAQPPKSARVKTTILPPHTEELSSVNRTDVRAPEVCVISKSEPRCAPFPIFKPISARPNVLRYRDFKADDCVVVREPTVLKSIMKLSGSGGKNCESDSYEEATSDLEVPDSLEYHKKVRFNKNKRQKSGEGLRKVMADFMGEAGTLIKNLREATDKFNKQQDFDVEVTVKNATNFDDSVLGSCKGGFGDNSTQTYSFDLPPNKYEILLEDSCKRLEEKINHDVKSYGTDTNRNVDEAVSQPNGSYNPWDLSAFEESSLESSNPVTFSDYGSLSRRSFKRYKTSSISPSAFLRQLTNMRKQVIESSREELFSNPDAN